MNSTLPTPPVDSVFKKLEDGGTYLNRLGQPYKVALVHEGSILPFEGVPPFDPLRFCEDGSYLPATTEGHPLDLVQRIK